MYKINHADIKQWAKDYDGELFDGILCDPPYELGFMGKSWDSTGIAYDKDMWADLFKLIKPGGHLLAFSGSRTYHRMAVAIEDAGFEIRDMIEWVYGSGFPKSLNIGKAVDKIQGNEREYVGINEDYLRRKPNGMKTEGASTYNYSKTQQETNPVVTKGNSPYEGYGTALKPAHEPCVLARKPIEGTVANNVLKHGTGGLNIDGSRITHNEPVKTTNRQKDNGNTWDSSNTGLRNNPGNVASASQSGRFPSNLILDGSDEVVGLFPQSNQATRKYGKNNGRTFAVGGGQQLSSDVVVQGDSGSAARFFFQAVPDTLKYDTMSVCQCINANNVIRFLRTIQATTDNTAPLSAVDSQDEQLDQNVRSAITGCERCATLIAQELVRIKSLASSPQGLTAFQHFIKSYNSDTLTQNLVSTVEKWVNTDTTPTTTNLLTLFGCVLLAIDENTRQANQENNSDTFHLKYTAKASKTERNAGLEGFDNHKPMYESHRPNYENTKGIETPYAGAGRTGNANQNHHPTVKPLSLTKYLANLIKPPTGGRLLVPFSGSGSEMIGALQAGWEYVEGVELTEEYIPIAEARIKYWLEQMAEADKQIKLV